MNKDEQRIAIAEACGWKVPGSPEVKELTKNWVTGGSQNHFISPAGVWGGTASVPDYLNDLNAMHQAETLFIGPKEWGDYCDKLRWVITQHIEEETGPGGICGIVCLEMAVNATAAQRAEAFLRTLGKWVDSPHAP